MKTEPWMKKSQTKKGDMGIAKMVTLLIIAMVIADGVISFLQQVVQNYAIAVIAYISIIALVNTKLFEVWR